MRTAVNRSEPPIASTRETKLSCMDSIRIRGARTHNLKNLNLDLPRHRLIVITGLSGSGKSSLAFDTLYAEGQRRYVESLSAYARQFLQLMDKPDVDLIEGLSPAISIEQKATSHNPRSTVGTVTEIHDYLRLLYARVGDPYCPDHPEQKLAAMTISQMVDATLAMPGGHEADDPGAGDRQPQGRAARALRRTAREGLRARARRRQGVRDRRGAEARQDHQAHDRSRRRPAQGAREFKQRLAESFETALRHGDGRAIAVEMDSGRRSTCSRRNSRARSATIRWPSSSRGSSRSTTRWARARAATGSARSRSSIRSASSRFRSCRSASGAIKGWDRRNQFYFQLLQSLAKHVGFDVDKPFAKLPERVQQLILYGSGDEKIPFTYLSERGKPMVARARVRGHHSQSRAALSRDRFGDGARGTRQVPEQQAVPGVRRHAAAARGAPRQGRQRRQARAIFEISGLPLESTMAFFSSLVLDGQKAAIADRIVKEIISRLQFLNNVGLDYLSLDRSAETLSGGESQRIRLASQIGSGLTGVMYVLDEPSIGLHQRDNDRLLETLKHLRDLGNSVIVVEHDQDAINAADYVVDMGPGAGEHGGQVVAQGTPEDIRRAPHSLTGQYLAGHRQIPIPARRHRAESERMLTINGATRQQPAGRDARACRSDCSSA